MKKITEKTLLPLSLVITLSSGIFWLTKQYIQTEANAETISKVVSKQDQYVEDIQAIRLDIEIIKNEVKRISRR